MCDSSTQYHAALILLHRPFIQYSNTSADGLDLHFKDVCRKSCVSSAENIAIILEQYRARFELSQVYGTAVQHAGTAATAMMGEIVIQADPVERSRLVERLSSLKTAVSLMSRNYRGAGLMVSVINQFIRSITNRPSVARGEDAKPAQHAIRHDHLTRLVPASGPTDPLVSAQDPAMMATPLPQRWRLDPWSTFAPSPAGHLSPAGLPYLPSSFLEGIMDDFDTGEISGSFDSYDWDSEPTKVNHEA